MLELAVQLAPRAGEEWESVAAAYNAHSRVLSGELREHDAASCADKWRNVLRKKKPTGATELPADVALARDVDVARRLRSSTASTGFVADDEPNSQHNADHSDEPFFNSQESSFQDGDILPNDSHLDDRSSASAAAAAAASPPAAAPSQFSSPSQTFVPRARVSATPAAHKRQRFDKEIAMVAAREKAASETLQQQFITMQQTMMAMFTQSQNQHAQLMMMLTRHLIPQPAVVPLPPQPAVSPPEDLVLPPDPQSAPFP